MEKPKKRKCRQRKKCIIKSLIIRWIECVPYRLVREKTVLYGHWARDVSDVFYVWHSIHSMDTGKIVLCHIPIDDDQPMILSTCTHAHNGIESLDYLHWRHRSDDLFDSYSCPVNHTNRIGVLLTDHLCKWNGNKTEWNFRIRIVVNWLDGHGQRWTIQMRCILWTIST